MAKRYMVGTVDDKPLLVVSLNGIQYFVDEEAKKVFLDAVKLPEVTDQATAIAVLEMAK